MDDRIEGGCLCGQVRYLVPSESVYQLLCYCTDCQTVSGAAGYCAYGIATDRLEVTKGKPRAFDVQADSGRINSRRFCADCGTRLWAQLDEIGFASVNGMTLDDKEHFQPSSNHISSSAPSWCTINKSLDEFPLIPRES